MTLPTQIREQIERGKALQSQLTNPAPAGEELPEPVQPESVTPEPVAAPEVVPEGAHPVEPVATRQEDENGPSYAQRYRSLQGIFNSQKRRLDETLDRVGQLEQLITTMQAAPAAQGTRSSPPAFLTDKDAEEYGGDMVDFTRRAAREELAPVVRAVQTLQQQLAQLSTLAPQVRQVATNQQMSAEEKFFAVLGDQVEDWEDINDSAKFSDWLDVLDPVFGISRRVALNDARERLDIARVVSLFNQFKGGGAPAASSATQRARPNAASQLEKQVAPGRGSAATSAPVQKQARTWSPDEISGFYREKMQGKWKGKEAEAAALERDIFVAQREGRVVQNAA